MPAVLVGLSTIPYLKLFKNVPINLHRQHDNCLWRSEILVRSVKTASTDTKPLCGRLCMYYMHGNVLLRIFAASNVHDGFHCVPRIWPRTDIYVHQCCAGKYFRYAFQLYRNLFKIK
jgi:hypothetical protein